MILASIAGQIHEDHPPYPVSDPAVALIVISIPLIQRRIRPNVWYGFRVRRTLEDPKVWYAANRYSAFHLPRHRCDPAGGAPACYFSPGISFISDALICVGVTFAGWRSG